MGDTPNDGSGRRWRCWFGHRWTGNRWDGYRCQRCQKEPAACDNCGRQHDPNAFLTICTVTRSAL